MANMLIMATTYKTLKAKEKALQEEIKALQADMITAMAGKEKVTCGQYVISNQTITSHNIDVKRLQAEKPDIANEFMTEKVTSRFTVR